MKKMILSALAAATIFGGTTGAMAQGFDGRHDDRGNNRATVTKQVVRDGHGNRTVVKQVRNDQRRWNKGDRFDYRQNRYSRIAQPSRYHFREAPRGYQWVRHDNDALLVGITSGIVLSALVNAF